MNRLHGLLTAHRTHKSSRSAHSTILISQSAIRNPQSAIRNSQLDGRTYLPFSTFVDDLSATFVADKSFAALLEDSVAWAAALDLDVAKGVTRLNLSSAV